MIEDRDIDALAGEYVLGTLDADERTDVDRQRGGDAALDAAILAWEARLAPFIDLSPAIAPPANLYPAIEARLNGSTASYAGQPGETPRVLPQASAEVISLRARVRRWQATAIVSGLLAASLAGVIVLKPTWFAGDQSQFVAVLQKDSISPAFVVSVDIATKQLTVRQVSAEKLQGKSYELWLINANLPAPRSLGLVHDSGFTRGVTLAGYAPAVVESSVLAVSLEPEGGSTTGLPTGPVVFTGKLVQATP